MHETAARTVKSTREGARAANPAALASNHGPVDSRQSPRHGRLAGLAAALTLLLPLSGCTGFFVSPTTTTTSTNPTNPTTPTPTNTGDYAYVANSSAGSTSLSEYNVSAGSLTSVGTVSLGYVPVALAVAPSNSFLYAASAPGSTSPGVFLYSIATGGTLTVANGGNVLYPDLELRRRCNSARPHLE